MVLVCIVTIAYLLGRIKYLNMRQKAPAPDKTADEYDSDEYSVMMDWNEHPNIVKNSKYRLKKWRKQIHIRVIVSTSLIILLYVIPFQLRDDLICTVIWKLYDRVCAKNILLNPNS